MIGEELIEEKPITLSEALEILEKRKEKGELEFGQRVAYDYTQKFTKLSPDKSCELVDNLLKIEKVRDYQAVTLANLMPETKDGVRLVFAKERTSLTEDLIEQILSIINEYRK